MSKTNIQKTVFIKTFGCQMNEHDSEKILGMLEKQGYVSVEETAYADLIIYNTCCVRDHAELRVFGNIGALAKLKLARPYLMIAVCGCMMQQKQVAEKLYKRYPFVDIVFGTHSLHELERFLEMAQEGKRVFSVFESDGLIVEDIPIKRKHNNSAFVTIMYGCDNFCSYCVVPLVRGRERSREPSQIITEIEQLAADGAKEIMLLGQNVNSYAGHLNFPQLLQSISSIKGIERIRFMTSHPKDMSDELIKTIANNSNICKNIHLPVQSGSNRILHLMNRGYTREYYLNLVGSIRSRIPEAEITTDFIVGFPTETEEDFNETLDLVSQVEFAAAYTFMYSQRQGTQAAKMQDMPFEVKKQRLLRLNELQALCCKNNNEKYAGKTFRILIEASDEQFQYGKTDSGKTVYIEKSDLKIGEFVNVKVTHIKNNSLFGIYN